MQNLKNWMKGVIYVDESKIEKLKQCGNCKHYRVKNNTHTCKVNLNGDRCKRHFTNDFKDEEKDFWEFAVNPAWSY